VLNFLRNESDRPSPLPVAQLVTAAIPSWHRLPSFV
jgi:hypothetical protein